MGSKYGNKYKSKCGNIYPQSEWNVEIPKIIYQSWKTKTVPDHWKESPKSIKKQMPDWQYVLLDNEDNRKMVAKYFPDFLPYYDAFPYDIMRADAARYVFLYLYGGIYMDLDFIVQRDLSPLFTSTSEIFLVASGNVSSCYTNSFMASRPKSKFWLECIEEMKKPVSTWISWSHHFYILSSTGPLMLSRVTGKTSTVISVLPRKLIMPCSACNIKCNTCNAYLKPLEGSSWVSYDTYFFNFWLCNWKTVVACLVCIIILLLMFYLLYMLGVCPFNVFSSEIFTGN